MTDKYERQMKKGVLDMLVLRLLKSEAKYGYQIIQEMTLTFFSGEIPLNLTITGTSFAGNNFPTAFLNCLFWFSSKSLRILL